MNNTITAVQLGEDVSTRRQQGAAFSFNQHVRTLERRHIRRENVSSVDMLF